MSPRETIARSVFPAYQPPGPDDDPLEHQAAYLARWGRRVLVLAALLGATASALAALGFRGPNTAARLTAVEDSTHANSRRIDALEQLQQSTLYVACQTLQRVQPANSVPPQDCSR